MEIGELRQLGDSVDVLAGENPILPLRHVNGGSPPARVSGIFERVFGGRLDGRNPLGKTAGRQNHF
jgi:hypothetical protein